MIITRKVLLDEISSLEKIIAKLDNLTIPNESQFNKRNECINRIDKIIKKINDNPAYHHVDCMCSLCHDGKEAYTFQFNPKEY